MSAGGPAGVCGRGRGRITPGFRFCRPSEGTEAAGVLVHGKQPLDDSGASCEDLRGCFRLLPEKFGKTGAANPLKNERVGIGTGNPVNFDRVDDEGKGGRRIDDPRWDALARHVDEEDKLTRQFDGSGQNRNMIVINESGMCSLVLFHEPQQKPQPQPENRNDQTATSCDKRQQRKSWTDCGTIASNNKTRQATAR